MAILIPSYSTCTQRMTSGERRLAQRLEQKLEDDYLLWYDVPIGSKLSISQNDACQFLRLFINSDTHQHLCCQGEQAPAFLIAVRAMESGDT